MSMKNNHVHLFYNTSELFNTFRIIRDPLKRFASNSLGPLQLLQRHFLLFFCGFDRGASRVFRSFSRILYCIQLPHHFCSTANNGCKAQQKLFGASKRNILAPSSFSNSQSMHYGIGRVTKVVRKFNTV